jgi:hypothetical protein
VSRKRTDAFDRLRGSTVRGCRCILQAPERVLDAEEALRLGRPRGLTPEGVVRALQDLVFLEREQNGDRTTVLLNGHRLDGNAPQVLTQAVLDLCGGHGLHGDSKSS